MAGRFQGRSMGAEGGHGKALVFAATLIFALAVAAMVASSLWSAAQTEEATAAPSELAGYRLIEAVGGQQAIAEIDKLHGTDIDIVEAWIGRYQDGGVVWVAQARSEGKARQLLDDMVQGIQDGGTPFWGLTRREFQGVPLYAVRDARQLHLFYQRETQVVWLAAPPGAGEGFLSEVFRKVG